MRWRRIVTGVVAAWITAAAALAQDPGIAGKVGQRLDDVGRGLRREAVGISEGVRRRFDAVRADVQKMGVASRVYSRIHWDTALHEARIEVHPLPKGDGVVLRGTVADAAARDRAVALARDTVDVHEVIDELVPLASATKAAPPAH
jgi:hypothetical protein